MRLASGELPGGWGGVLRYVWRVGVAVTTSPAGSPRAVQPAACFAWLHDRQSLTVVDARGSAVLGGFDVVDVMGVSRANVGVAGGGRIGASHRGVRQNWSRAVMNSRWPWVKNRRPARFPHGCKFSTQPAALPQVDNAKRATIDSLGAALDAAPDGTAARPRKRPEINRLVAPKFRT